MSEINNTVFHKSSKQLLSLAKTLTNNTILQDRLAESLLLTHNVETKKKKKVRHKFSGHPDPLTSESDILVIHPFKNAFSETSLTYSCNKTCGISAAHSAHSVISGNHFVQHSKSSERTNFSPNASICSHKMEVTAKQLFACTSLLKVQEKNAPHTPVRDDSSIMQRRNDVPNKSSGGAKSNVNRKNVDQKLRSYVQRISICMEDIRSIMKTGIEPPDGAEDWERARVRTVEFSSRFSRNYLYQLGREMNELQGVTKNSGNISNRTAKNIHQRLLSAHQTILQALQVYRSHMTTLLANSLADKLLYVAEQTYTLCTIHLKYLNLKQTGSIKRESLIDGLIKKCNTLLEVVEDVIDRRGQINKLVSPATRLSLMGYNVHARRVVKPKPRKKAILEARLSMYSVTSCVRNKDAFWKNTVEILAKDKLRYNHVQSRYKTAAFKHRPPPEKVVVNDLPSKTKLFPKRSSCLLRNTPIDTPCNEDEIVTLVEMQNNKDNTSNVFNISRGPECNEKSIAVKDMQLQALTPLIQGLCQQVCSNDTEAMSQKQLENMLRDLLGMALDRKINNNTNNSNNENESGSKKNGYLPQKENVQKLLFNTQQIVLSPRRNDSVQVLSKNDSPHQLPAKQTETPPLEADKLMNENKRNLLKIFKNLENSAVMLEKFQDKKLERDSTDLVVKESKVESGEVNSNKLKKSDNSQTCTNTNKRRQTITVTGAKNAQLICIRDEDSIIESPDNKTTCSHKDTPRDTTSELQKTRKNSAKVGNTNTTSKNKVKSDPLIGKANIRINRLPKKSLKQLVLIPKSEAFNVIQYKLQYSKFSKVNHMYRKNATVQPWALLDSISEHLLNDLLLSVAREIEVDSILESLYQSEFQ